MNLFKQLMGKPYGTTIDWFLQEGKFDGWDKNEVTRFTKMLHSMLGFSKDRDLHYEPVKDIVFPKKAVRFPQVWMASGNSEGRDWIRHIRNGIAHGNATVRKLNGELIIEITDFQVDGRTQTAYILIPLEYLNYIMKAYKDAKK